MVESPTPTAGAEHALRAAARDDRLRAELLDSLRRAEARSADPDAFRATVRWPLVLAVLEEVGAQRVELASGLVFEVGADSRIEQALLLSSESRPDHVWEPQTTKLLLALAAEARPAVVGGAYIGDHALVIAQALARHGEGIWVHAFEPMTWAFERLLRNRELSGLRSLRAERLALWDASGVELALRGAPALASSRPAGDTHPGEGETVQSISVDDYVAAEGLESIGLLMLDTEGGEERALAGAERLLGRPFPEAPRCVFEVHRDYVDWSEGLERTDVARFLSRHGYRLLAIRDVHGNHPMRGQPIEVVPIDRVHLEGPPHGFNLLATKDPNLVDRLGLRVVPDVSPKLLLDRDSALHHPIGGFVNHRKEIE
jgi:FkbM family methyltransferase